MKNYHKTFLIFCLLASLLGTVSAELAIDTNDQTACPTDTVLFIATVTNSGSSPDSYTMSLSGEASNWAVAAPAGFSLGPGESQQVYIYVTPQSSSLTGTYNLEIIATGKDSGKQSEQATITIGDCHSATLTADTTLQETCAGISTAYTATLENTGKYTENFALSLSGSAQKWASLSDSFVRLGPGASKTITVTATPPADQTGDFSLTLGAKSDNSNALASLNLNLKSKACYGYDLRAEKNYVSFCENSEVKLPVFLKNSGSVDNKYQLSIDGIVWSTLDQNTIDVPAGGERNFNVVLYPGFGISGDYKLKVKAKSTYGEVLESQDITANVLTCYSSDTKISENKDKLCPQTSKTYEVSLVNTGKDAENFAISVSGVDWAKLDTSFVNLSARESKKFNLIVEPKDAKAGDYALKLISTAQGQSHSISSDTLQLTIAPMDECFGVQTTAALTNVEVAPGDGALVPIIIENKGLEASTYNVEVSGTGAAFAKLNPASLKIEGRKAETVYMYLSVPEETPRQEYKLTVAARLEDGTISSSSDVALTVVPPAKEEIANKPAPTTGEVKSVISSFWGKLTEIKQTLKNYTSSLAGKVLSVFPKIQNETATNISLQSQIKEKISALISFKTPSTKVEVGNVSTINASETNTTAFMSEAVQKKLAESENKSETISENTSVAAEENKTTENITVENTTNTTTTSFMSEEVQKKLAAENTSLENGTVAPAAKASLLDKLKEKLSFAKISGASTAITAYASKAQTFLVGETYGFANWMWLAGIVIVLIIILIVYGMSKSEDEVKELIAGEQTRKVSSADEKKKGGTWQKFVDWLDEEDEGKEEEKTEEKPADERMELKTAEQKMEKNNKQKAKPKPKPKKQAEQKEESEDKKILIDEDKLIEEADEQEGEEEA